jgi:hypothetical protein
MSKKVDESYYFDKEAGEDEDRKCPPRRVPLVKDEDRKCPPRRVPLVNPNEEWTSHKPKERISLRSNDDPHQKHEAAAIEKLFLLTRRRKSRGELMDMSLPPIFSRTSCGQAMRTATLRVALWVTHTWYQH